MARTPATPRRAAPTKVSKPFPWATVLGSLVLGAALVGLIVYAALNQGSGVRDLVRNPDAAVKGVAVDTSELKRGHVAGAVKYAQTPPNSGDHNGLPQTCQVYDAAIAPEHAVHSMEHGAVWVTYRPDLPADQVEVLRGLVEGDAYRMLSPYPGQTAAVSLQAWGRTVTADSATDEVVEKFLRDYTNGPQTREVGAACSGNAQPGETPVA